MLSIVLSEGFTIGPSFWNDFPIMDHAGIGITVTLMMGLVIFMLGMVMTVIMRVMTVIIRVMAVIMRVIVAVMTAKPYNTGCFLSDPGVPGVRSMGPVSLTPSKTFLKLN